MNLNSCPEGIEEFLTAFPEVEVFQSIQPDLNGHLRGKWLPRADIRKAFAGGLKLPLSTLAFDMWGRDPAGWVFERGDVDGFCEPDTRSLSLVPWLERPTAQFLTSLYESPGSACGYDPRNLLRLQSARLEQEFGLTAVLAFEMEFYLLDAHRDPWGRSQPVQLREASAGISGQTYGVDVVEEISVFLHAVCDACRVQKLPVDTLIAESGPSQFEINLVHQPDALLAADHAVLLKRAIKGVANGYGYRASFMAKPFIDRPGNGMHVHCSLIDGHGRNVFDNGSSDGSEVLCQAVAGCLSTMAETMLLFAPNRNSYRRFRPDAHAPMTATWGYDNRTVAIRIPSGGRGAMRIEQRVAGGDANPYLVAAGVLAGILAGLEERPRCPDPVRGNAYAKGGNPLPSSWTDALNAFTSAESVSRSLGIEFQRIYADLKREEIAEFEREISPLEYRSCL